MNKWDFRFLELAKTVASWSKDPSTRCGSVIVDSNKRIISLGFNGFPAGMCDRKEDYEVREVKMTKVIHSEMNSLLFAKQSVEGCSIYVYPFLPCSNCSLHLIQAGIKKVVAPKATEDQLSRWGESFKRTKAFSYECGVEVLEVDFKNENK